MLKNNCQGRFISDFYESAEDRPDMSYVVSMLVMKIYLYLFQNNLRFSLEEVF